MERNKILYPEIESTLRKSKYVLSKEDKISTFKKIIEALPENKPKRLFPFTKLSFAFSTLIVILIAVFGLFLNTLKQEPVPAKVISGSANTLRQKIQAGNIIKTKNFIQTKAEECEIRVAENSLIKLFENTKLKIYATKDKKLMVELKRGLAFFDVKKQSTIHFIITTPHLEIFVKGTTFSVEVKSKEETVVTLIEGNIELKSKKQQQLTELKTNEIIVYRKGKIEQKRELSNEDAKKLVEWKKSIHPASENVGQTVENLKPEILRVKIENLFPENLSVLNNNLICFNENKLMIHSEDGKLILEKKISAGTDINTLSVIKDTLYITMEGGGLLAYDKKGNLLWENKEAGIVKFFSAPVEYENFIFLATIDKGIQIFDSRNGSLVDSINPEKKEAIYNSPLIVNKNSLIYFTESGNLIHYDFINKKNIWKITLGDRFVPPIVMNGNAIYIISKNQKRLIAINVENGNLLWEKPINFDLYTDPLKLFKGNLILVGKKEIFVYDSTNGKLLSSLKLNQNIKKILGEGKKFYVLFDNSQLNGYELPELKKLYEQKFDENVENILIADNYLLILGKDFLIRKEKF